MINTSVENTNAQNLQSTMNIYRLTQEEHTLVKRLGGCADFDFHTWCVDKTTGEIVDDYLNENTSIGQAFKTRMKVCKVTRVTHKPFEKLPEYCKKLKKSYDKIVKNITHYETMKTDYKSYDNYGSCFQRAYKHYLNNPDTYEIIIERCYFYLKDGEEVVDLPSSACINNML